MENVIKNIGGVEYRFKPTNASTTWALTRRFLADVGSKALGSINPEDPNGTTAVVGELLSKLNSPVMSDVQGFILNHTVILDAETGKPQRLAVCFDVHFGERPENLLPVLIEGFKVFFLKFLGGFQGLLNATSD